MNKKKSSRYAYDDNGNHKDEDVEKIEADESPDEDVEIIGEGGPEEQLRKLREKLKQCRKEREEYLDGWQRSRADFVNARKEEEKSRQEFMLYSEERLIREFLPILDNFDRAFNGADPENPYTKGFSYIRSEFLKLLEARGLTAIEAQGKLFDPRFHEAISNRDVEEKGKDGIIVKELEKGYMLHGKVIKPSKVEVGTYKESEIKS